MPVRELAVDEDSVNVEMDPEDEVRAADNIAATPGLRCGQSRETAYSSHIYRWDGQSIPQRKCDVLDILRLLLHVQSQYIKQVAVSS